AARKKKLPYLPEVIGVVTSPSGAVIRDILHRLRDRFPRQVLIWPVAVQGKDCAPQVARAIAGFNDLRPGGPIPRPDLLIVARGGGSVEDLWGFNEEIVARAAAASDIPLISAVGHETDTTLIDYVADVRAPTPTAAAELAVPVRLDLLAWAGEQEARLSRALTQNIGQKGQRLRDLTRALPKPDRLLDGPRQRLDRSADRLPQALQGVVHRRRLRLSEKSASLRPATLKRRLGEAARQLADRNARLRPEALMRATEVRRTDLQRLGKLLATASRVQLRDRKGKLEALERMRQSLGYTETLRRGYAVVRAEGQVVTTAAEARSANLLEIEFADARVTATPTDGGPAASSQTKKSPKKAKPPKQGSLF
ncbi:MAG: exodeoxyribonuclease VII large subunit, partial [Paracoccaceae bacterium]|nr:exodeoxyribonuclease VII large subunit [Paracoccaceae bacterium]